MMRRTMVAVIACLSLGTLNADSPAGQTTLAETLPKVSTAPGSWSEFEAGIQPASATLGLEDLGAADPEVAAVLRQFRFRHTGLSDDDLHQVAVALLRESRRHDLDPRLIVAVMQVESSCYNFAVSSVGALGLMQIMPFTGEYLAMRLDLEWQGPDSLFDPVLNITLGTAYLRMLSDRYGSLPAALAAYNWGPTRIDGFLRRGDSLPSEYVQQVMRVYDFPAQRLSQRS